MLFVVQQKVEMADKCLASSVPKALTG